MNFLSILQVSENPFAIIALTVKGKQIKEKQLYDLKLNLVKRLLKKKIAKEKIRVLMNFLRFYIRFDNNEMECNFEKEVEVLTQKNSTMGLEEYLLDRAKKEGRLEGKEEGRQEGRKERKEEGRKEGFISTAENLLKRGLSIQEVSEITTLTVEEVTGIAKKPKK